MKSMQLKGGLLNLWIFLLFITESTNAQLSHTQVAQRNYQAQSISDQPNPAIDGYLEEDIWNAEDDSWSTNFTQRVPYENQAPSAQTAFKITYNEKFLFVGIRCFEEDPELINQWMSRRDGYTGDWVEIILDSYHDLRSAFSFSISVAGVKSDKFISLNGAEEDLSWDPIWYAQSAIDSLGWTAEIKIPFSQLRFGNQDEQVWGLQVQRRILRKEEWSLWQRIPQDAPGWVSEFGKLNGIKGIRARQQLEIQPFIVNKLQKPSSNKQIQSKLGLDGKIGLGNDLTIDFTINPDFGQVEADPAAINLDGFQLFFQERRPFFVENKNIFDYRFSTPIIGSIYSSDNLFYTRRIGRKPQINLPDSIQGDFSIPQQSNILAALKLSGKTKNGLSIGILESLTAPEYAIPSALIKEEKYLVEPLTNYFVARIQQDFNQRNTFIGGMFTSTLRNQTASTDLLHHSAHTGGLDFFHQWKNRSWYASANLIMSHVAGSRAAILQTQQAIPHLFQRVQSPHLVLDSNRTSLTGTGGDLKVGKAGNGHMQFESGLTWRSPGLELNDIGFMREADIIQHYFGITYRSLTAFGIFRSARIGYKHWLNWDFSGKLNYIDWDIELNANFQNNWSATFGFFSQPHIYSKTLLQGGPRIKLTDQYGFWWASNTDARKKLYLAYQGWTKMGAVGSYYLLENSLSLNFQPINRIKFSMGPKYTMIRHRLQYNTRLSYKEAERNVVSMLDQNTLGIALRADVLISPNMAIQYYGEPFISRGQYKDFGYIVAPDQLIKEGQIHFFKKGIDLNENLDKNLMIDENLDGEIDYTIKNPDFTYVQFRSNLVFRWEYKPGSEFYLVWSQGLINQDPSSRSLLLDLRESILANAIDHTFLMKATYRFHK